MSNSPHQLGGYRVSVKAIITDDNGKLLLVHEKDGSWGLPGGRLEYGETPMEGLHRELNEELGISDATIDRLPVGVITGPIGENGYALLLCYQVMIVEQPQVTTEVHEYRYVDRLMFETLPMNEIERNNLSRLAEVSASLNANHAELDRE